MRSRRGPTPRMPLKEIKMETQILDTYMRIAAYPFSAAIAMASGYIPLSLGLALLKASGRRHPVAAGAVLMAAVGLGYVCGDLILDFLLESWA